MKNTPKKEKLKVFIVDDEPAFCKALKKTLQEHFEVCAFTNPAVCLNEIKKSECDLLIADYKMKKMNGIELLEKVKQFAPDMPVLIVSGFGDIHSAVSAIKKGAFDFIQKPLSKNLLLSEVNRILEKKLNGPTIKAGIARLSKSELHIFKLILEGKSNKEIAYKLCRSRRTIEDHRCNIMKKLSADNIVELTKLGIRLGLTGSQTQLTLSSANIIKNQ
jgi:two-component system response regulator FixJ